MEAMGLALSKNTALKYQKRDLEKMLHLSIYMNENGTNDQGMITMPKKGH